MILCKILCVQLKPFQYYIHDYILLNDYKIDNDKINLNLLVYVGHLAVVVALQALSLSLLPLAAPSAALGPSIAIGTPGTEAPGGGH